MQRVDSLEHEVGILSYASSIQIYSGFAAVLKARYSDFLVHEVGLDGEIARLASLENNLVSDSQEQRTENTSCNSSNKRCYSTECNNNANKNNGADDDDDGKKQEHNGHDDPCRKKTKLETLVVKKDPAMIDGNDSIAPFGSTPAVTCMDSFVEDEMLSKLMPLVGEEAARGAIQMLTKWEKFKESNQDNLGTATALPPKGSQDNSKYFVFPLIEDKQTRKSIHELLKSELFKPFAVADTVDRCVRIWHSLFETQMPNYGKFIRDEKYVNRSQAKKKLQWPEGRPNFLRFVLYKENIDTGTAAKDIAKMMRLVPQGKNRVGGGGGGGLDYAGMKDKRGCTTQFCTLYRKTAEEVLVLNQGAKSARPQGGGNSKTGGGAIMRVGHFSYVSQDIRLGQLKGNRFDIVLRNVCTENTVDSSLTRQERLSRITATLRDAVQCFKETGFINYFGMQRFGKFHDTHQVGIALLKGEYEEACDIIMRVKEGENERSVATRQKWANRFHGVDMSDAQAVKDAEMKCARVVARELGRFMNCETSIVSSLSRTPRDYKKAFSSISKHMRSMFVHAYQSYVWNRAASHRIIDGGSEKVRVGDLVLTEDRGLLEGGNGTSGLKGKIVKALTQDDVEAGNYQITDVVLPMIGPKIELPTDSTGSIYDNTLAEVGLTIKDFNNLGDRELATGGDYRKLICKPSDIDFDIKLYKDPLQPLIMTDLMHVHRASLDCVDIVGDADAREDFARDTMADNNLVGLVIGFTLPPSAYATIALRELMRRPTSAEYQTELSLEGECEANVMKHV